MEKISLSLWMEKVGLIALIPFLSPTHIETWFLQMQCRWNPFSRCLYNEHCWSHATAIDRCNSTHNALSHELNATPSSIAAPPQGHLYMSQRWCHQSPWRFHMQCLCIPTIRACLHNINQPYSTKNRNSPHTWLHNNNRSPILMLTT